METKKSSATTSKKLSGESSVQMKANPFHKLFMDELKDIYWAEKHLSKSLPKLAKGVTTEDLEEAFNNHLEETNEQIKKLERVFELLGEKAVAKKCDAMEGLVEEAQGILEDTEKDTWTRDAALISAAQKIEHYEIASYGVLTEFARTMGHDDVVSILEEILDEEKTANETLNELALGGINEEAFNEWNEDGEEEESKEEE
jgi:ferritin-like metal-binding protein YciE